MTFQDGSLPTAMEAALQCAMCGETRHWIGRVTMILAPHPMLPWCLIHRPVVAINKEQVSQWASGHVGPIMINHFHPLE